MHTLLVAILLAQSPSLSYEGNATFLSQHLAELSRVVGKPLSAEPSLGGQVAVIRLNKVTEADALQRVAQATIGRWDRDGEKYILRPDKAKMVEIRTAQQKLKTEAIRKRQAEILKSVQGGFTLQKAKDLKRGFAEMDAKYPGEKALQEGHAAFNKLKPLMPAHVALCRILGNLDPTLLLEEGEVDLVFSDKPNRLQIQLPPSAVQAVRQLEKDHRLWTSVNTVDQESVGGRWTADARFYTKPIADGGMRLLLKVNRSPGRGGHVTAWFINEAKELVQFAEESLNISPSDVLPPKNAQDEKVSIAIPPEILPWINVFHMQGGMERQFPNADQLEKVSRPDLQEPLGLALGPLLLSIANARDLNLVACLPDNAMGATDLQSRLAKPPTLATLQSRLGAYGVHSETEGGFWVMRALSPDSASSLPRPLLRAVVREAREKGSLSIATAADLLQAGVQDYNVLLSLYMAVALPGLERIVNFYNMEALKVLGLLTAQQKTILDTGGKVPLSALPPNARTALERVILSGATHEFQLTDRQNSGRFIQLETEPTEVLVSGLDPAAYLALEKFTSPVAIAKSEEEFQSMSPYSMAQAIRDLDQGKANSYYAKYADRETVLFLPATQTSYTLAVAIRPGLMFRKTFQWTDFDLRKTPGKFSQLPSEFQKEFDRAVESYKNMPPPR